MFYLVVAFSSLKAVGQTDPKSFEGVVTYDISFEPKAALSSEQHRQYFEQKYGKEAKYCYNRNGDFKRIYENSGPNGVEYFLYKKEENMFYAKFRPMDTLFASRGDFLGLKLIREDSGISEEVILGQACQYYEIIGVDTSSGQIARQKFYYGENFYLDPELYVDLKSFFANKVAQKMKAPFLKLELDMSMYIYIYTAKSIDEKKVKEDYFTVPELPIKEI